MVTSPMPLSTISDVAPETLQDKVECSPGVMLEGVATKEEIVGKVDGLVTNTVTRAVTLPALFAAVNV